MSEKVICLRTPGSYEGILLECKIGRTVQKLTLIKRILPV